MRDRQRLRNSTLIQFLCDEQQRILNVLRDLMCIEIPDNPQIQFFQDAELLTNPIAITHVCVVINSDAYIIFEDSGVLNPLELRDSYSHICSWYGVLLEEKVPDWKTITPIILSTSGLIRLSNYEDCVFEEYIPAIDMIGEIIAENEKGDVRSSRSINDCEDDEDEEMWSDGEDETWTNEARGCHPYLRERRKYNECCEGKISEAFSFDEQKKLMRKIHPDMDETLINMLFNPHSDVFVARHKDSIGGPWEFRIFDLSSSLASDGQCECVKNRSTHSVCNERNLSLLLNSDLRNYIYCRQRIEKIPMRSREDEMDVYMADSMSEEGENAFREFLRQPGAVKHFLEELALYEFVIYQRKAASLCAQNQVKSAIESLQNLF